MNFVNEKDGIRVFLQLLQYALQALLEVAPVLGAGQQGAHVQGVHRGLGEDFRHLVFHHPAGQALGDGGLAHPGFTHQQGVVLPAPAQGLDHPFQLRVTADQGVDLALQRQVVEIDGEVFQGAGLGLLLFTLMFPFGGRLGLRHLADAVGDEIHHVQAGDALFLQVIDRVGVLLAEDGHQHVGPVHFLLAGGLDMQDGPLDDALEPQGGLGVDFVVAGNRGGVLGNELGHVLAQLLHIGATGPQGLGSSGVVQQGQEQVLHGDELVTLLPGFDKGNVQTDFQFLGDHQFSSMTQARGCWCCWAKALT